MNKQQLLESLKQKGFSKEIVRAFSEVKREDFIIDELKENAYEDTSLPIGHGQTISQPYTIAVMLSLLDLKKGQKVLEVGSGSGYVLALISNLIGKDGEVFGIEIVKELAEKSKMPLKEYKNIQVYNQNGSFGIKEKSPFDRIIISAACKKIPKELTRQLKEDGVIVAPVESGDFNHSITSFKKISKKLKPEKEVHGFVFVPFVNKNKK